MHQHTIQDGRITLTFHGIKEEDIKEGQQAPPNQVVHSMRGQTHSRINNNNQPCGTTIHSNICKSINARHQDLGVSKSWTPWRRISTHLCNRQIRCCSPINKPYNNSRCKWVRCLLKWVKEKEGLFPANLRLIPGILEPTITLQILNWIQSTYYGRKNR